MIDPNKMLANFEAQDGYIASLQAESERLREALSCLLAEARGVCWMTGAREFLGNTNQQCLQRRIEQAEQALSTKDSQS